MGEQRSGQGCAGGWRVRSEEGCPGLGGGTAAKWRLKVTVGAVTPEHHLGPGPVLLLTPSAAAFALGGSGRDTWPQVEAGKARESAGCWPAGAESGGGGAAGSGQRGRSCRWGPPHLPWPLAHAMSVTFLIGVSLGLCPLPSLPTFLKLSAPGNQTPLGFQPWRNH